MQDMHAVAAGTFSPPCTVEGDMCHQTLPGGDAFQGGRMHGGAAYWHRAIAESGLPDTEKELLTRTIERGVSLHDFYVPPEDPAAYLAMRGVDTSRPARPAAQGNARFPSATQRNSQPPLPAGMGDPATFVNSELASLLRTGAIQEVTVGSSQIVSPIFVTTNSSETKLRLVYAAVVQNEFVPSPPVKFPRLGELARWLKREGLMVVMDYQAAYHSLRLSDESSTLCGFRWQGKEYQWKCVPFGLAPIVYLFQLFATVSTGFVRKHAHLLAMAYIDDTGAAAATRYEAQCTAWVLTQAAWLAGHTLSPLKCQLEGRPVQRLLGLLLDAPNQAFVIPPDKVKRVQGFLAYLRDPAHPVVHVLTLERFAGLLVSLLPALPPVLMFLRDVFAWVAGANRGGHEHVDVSGEKEQEVLRELSELPLGTHMFSWAPESHVGLKVALATDASLTGYGAMLVDVRSKVPMRYDWAMPVPAHESGEGIMRHEAMAICAALAHFGPAIAGQRVRFLTDNECVRYALRRWRGSRNLPLNDAAKEFYRLLLVHNVTPSSVCRITTDDNEVPDEMSRLVLPATLRHPFKRVLYASRADLGASLGYAAPLAPGTRRSGAPALSATVFAAVQGWYTGVTGSPLSIDVCASPLDRRLPRFIALEPAPDTEGFVGTDLFSYAPDPEEHCYINPPWQHLAPMLRHLQDVGARGALIFPLLTEQIWFSIVHQVAIAPVQIVAHQGTRAFEDTSVFPARKCAPCALTMMVAAFDFSGRGRAAL